MHSPGGASYFISCLHLVMSKHLFRLARKSVQAFFNRDTFLKFYNEHYLFIVFKVVRIISTSLLIIMSSPGQKRGSCGHVMALFDNHKKCARCCEKGVGDDPCVKKQDCQICKAFTFTLRFNNWPPRLTKQGKNVVSRRNLKILEARPPLSWTLQM